MRNALREPLLHFLVLGLLLFAFFEWRGGGTAGGRIVVTAGQLQHFAAGFARTRQREPTGEELKGLVDEYVKEEMAGREAIASGLDRDDAIIRKRLRQKLEFLVEDAVDQAPPTDAELRAWMADHPHALRAEGQVAIRQVFVRRERPGAAAEATRLLARLRAGGPGADTARLGDPTTLPPELPLGPVREVALTFGDALARAVEAEPPGQWFGPVESAYGLHLILVSERVPATVPDLAAVRPMVVGEVVAERRRRALAALYDGLLTRYRVTVERPAVPAADAGAGR
jgi:hypothetical protein